ncbi:MAG: alpha/beta fold hydrolase [Spirochaetia bacterium]
MSGKVLRYAKYGSGRPLIILHGLLGSGDNWQSQAKHLARGYAVYTPDLRNHGSSFHDEEMSYPAMAEDVRRLMHADTIERPFVMGHSMGGKTAMELALRYPKDVEALVVVDIAPFPYKPIYGNLFSALEHVDVESITGRKDAEEQLKPYVSDRMVRLFLLKNLRRTDEGGFAWRVNLESLSRHYNEIWAGLEGNRVFEGPVLFVEGEKSRAEITERWDEIKEYFPRAENVVIPRAGHWVHAEKPREFLRIVTGFLDSL